MKIQTEKCTVTIQSKTASKKYISKICKAIAESNNSSNTIKSTTAAAATIKNSINNK